MNLRDSEWFEAIYSVFSVIVSKRQELRKAAL